MAGQHEPRLQTPCKRLQHFAGAAKGSRAGWYRKAARSETSLQNSLGPKWDWLEVHGEVLHLRTAPSWLLARWVVGDSEEAMHRTLSSRGTENPEEKDIALSLKKWVPLALEPAAEQKKKHRPRCRFCRAVLMDAGGRPPRRAD